MWFLEKDEEWWDQKIGEKVMYEMDPIHADVQIRAWRDKSQSTSAQTVAQYLHSNLDLLEMCIHGSIYADHGSTDSCAILQFNCDDFSVQLLQEFD